jgi:hypothetical protein
VNNALASTLLTAGVSAVAGVLAWVVVNFFADPLLEFRRQRKAIHESLFFTANVASFSKKEEIESARSELRRHAAALSALWATAPWSTKQWLNWRGYNVANAATSLTGFSNSIELEEGSKAIHRHRIEKGLGFALSYTDEEMRDVVKANRERATRS